MNNPTVLKRELLKIHQIFLIAVILNLILLFCIGCSSESNPKTIDPTETQSQSLRISEKLDIVLSNSDQGSNPADKFSFPNKIFAFVNFPEEFNGKRNLEAHWIRPDGQMQENAFFTHDFSSSNSRRVYFWFEFNEASFIQNTGHALVSSNEDGEQFNGVWNLVVKCDGQEVARSTFSVSGAPH